MCEMFTNELQAYSGILKRAWQRHFRTSYFHTVDFVYLQCRSNIINIGLLLRYGSKTQNFEVNLVENTHSCRRLYVEMFPDQNIAVTSHTSHEIFHL